MKFSQYVLSDKVSLVYGFSKSAKIYTSVMCLAKKRSGTYIYGFLSKKPFSYFDFKTMWEFIGTCTDSEYIVFEALPVHASVYKMLLPIDRMIKTRTFTGFESETFFVKRGSNFKRMGFGQGKKVETAKKLNY